MDKERHREKIESQYRQITTQHYRAYNVEENKVIVRKDESINAQSTLSLIRQIMTLQPTAMIYLIAENAKYYCSKKVKEFLEQNPRVKLIFLPFYSPNLNLIE